MPAAMSQVLSSLPYVSARIKVTSLNAALGRLLARRAIEIRCRFEQRLACARKPHRQDCLCHANGLGMIPEWRDECQSSVKGCPRFKAIAAIEIFHAQIPSSLVVSVLNGLSSVALSTGRRRRDSRCAPRSRGGRGREVGSPAPT